MNWKNGWDQAKATQHCMDAMVDNVAYIAIKDIKGVDIDGAISDCVLDIQVWHCHRKWFSYKMDLC